MQKNVIIFDNTKWWSKIDFFDYSNIKWRSGRMMKHYVGNVYNFNNPPQDEEVVIDIPFFEQNPATKEVLIHLEKNEILPQSKEKFDELERLPVLEKELYKSNGVLVDWQKKIYDKLSWNIDKYHKLLYWKQFPNYEQLLFLLGMCRDNLIKVWETTSPMTKKKLVYITNSYWIDKSMRVMIDNNINYIREQKEEWVRIYQSYSTSDIKDEAIKQSFNIARHRLQYKVPKRLNVMNEIQKTICNINNLPAWDYTFYAGQLENDFVRKNLSLLIEMWIPKSALYKIEPSIPTQLSEEQVIWYIREKRISKTQGLLSYEAGLIENL